MTVLVALQAGEAGHDLLASARVLAHAAGWDVRVLHVKEHESESDLELPARLRTATEVVEAVGDPVQAILAAAGASGSGAAAGERDAAAAGTSAVAGDVTMLAFNLRRAAGEGIGQVADALLRRASLPLLVTRHGMEPVGALRRLLVPLEGSPSASEAMRFTEAAFCDRGREIIALHVGTSDTPNEPGSLPAPRMVDQEQYEWSAWHEEFTMRFAACPSGGRHRTVVQVGDPDAVIVEQIAVTKAELVVVSWGGDLAEGRAEHVRSLLQRSSRPLLLIPPGAAPPAA